MEQFMYLFSLDHVVSRATAPPSSMSVCKAAPPAARVRRPSVCSLCKRAANDDRAQLPRLLGAHAYVASQLQCSLALAKEWTDQYSASSVRGGLTL